MTLKYNKIVILNLYLIFGKYRRKKIRREMLRKQLMLEILFKKKSMNNYLIG